ncbi:DedA protein [hydrothermal vent metagenome]|uniref:DedA protein n=1 Tax=hydrothermal vent metagenome TaxID=652676 RepID=A0A3B1B8X3_9ZZZZ
MAELLQQLLQWVSLNPIWAGVAIFLITMSESLAIIGLLVPGVVLMFGFGAMITTGTLSFWPTFGWAVAGAITGDGLSYFLGRYYRDQLTNLWPFNKYPSSLERGIAFFQRYGGKSVAIGRFFGPVRAVIPLVAGMLGMPPGRFVAANVASALVWAPAYLLPGMVLGASLELASEVAFRLVILILLLVAMIWFMIWSIKRLFILFHPHASAWVQSVLNWSQGHPMLRETAAALADPQHPEARGLAIMASLLIFTTGLFALLFGTVLGETLNNLNHTVLQAMQSLRTPWADHLMVYLTRLGDAPVMMILALGVLLFLAQQHHWRTAYYWLAAVGFGFLASLLLKYSLQIPRPDIGIKDITPYSFPSSHVLRATVLYGFLAIMIARTIPPLYRWLPYNLAGLLIVPVAISRLYLGVHWLTDVIASLALGMAWIALLGIAYHRHTIVETRWRSLAAATIAILLVTIGIQTWRNHPADMAFYTPIPSITTITTEEWWDNSWQNLPQQRHDTQGQRNHPLHLQYAGTLDGLQQALAKKGWQQAPSLTWGDSLKLLSPSLPLSKLPVLPQVHSGQHETITLIKQLSDNGRLVLRLWQSNILLSPGQIPLWLGNATKQQQAYALNLITFAETAPDFEQSFNILLQSISDLPHKQNGNLLMLQEN